MTMPAGTVIIPGSQWVWPAAALLIVAVLLVLWSYRRAPRIGRVHKIAFCLKLLGVSALVLCLIEPLWSGRRAESGANLFVVAADNSGGMSIRDQGASVSRGEILREAFKNGAAEWLAALADDFQVRRYIFDSKLRSLTDFSALTFDGKATAIGASLRAIVDRYQGRPLAGVLLMTDGNATDMGEKPYDFTNVPPVYPVVIGGERPRKDIALVNASVTQTSFEDAPVTIQADVEASGYSGRTVAVELLDDSGVLVERQQWEVRRNDEKQVFRFRLRPEAEGLLYYRLNAAEMVLGGDSGDRPEGPPEATRANNERTIVVDRGKGPYRILYVAGRPNWEYKFLQRAISEDRQVQMVGLLRVARREPKYDWRGHAGEQSNPLYRGFDPDDPEQTEQYDQPVIVRLNTRDETELVDGFPKTAEELFGYHAVILDDVEAGFFSQDQMDLLRRFVAERGGGLLMLGGMETFQKGGYRNTAVGDILPVYLDRLPDVPGDTRVSLSLTREGWLQPWARLRDNEQAEQERLSRMPEFRVLNRVRAVKPGARVIATIGGERTQQLPALVVQRFGSGRSAALTIGDIWRWGLKDPDMRDDMYKFWRQALRWLVADVPGRISLQAVHAPDQANQPVALRALARGKDFEPLDNVSVKIEVREPGGQNVRLTAEPDAGQSGLFEAAYLPRVSGGYFARAVITDAEGNELGSAEAGWAVDMEAREFQSLKTNRPLLEKIAGQTGGRVIELAELDDFVRTLPGKKAPITAVWVKPLWDLPGLLPVIFVFLLFCLGAEWALRRWKGIP
ncbi:MAG: hypothetical protein JSU94_14065 [Phycisphaerales bacterium]|nr:MAG: hypothetical protein JSU94_14065 [Phycisphaerales bacterium]